MPDYVYLNFFHVSVQLLLLEGIFAAPLPRRPHFLLRLAGMLCLHFTAGLIYTPLMQGLPPQFYPITIFYYVLLFAATLLILYGAFHIGFKEVLFVGTAGYAVQHITYAAAVVSKQLIRLWGGRIAGWVDEVVFSYLLYLGAGLVCYVLLVRPNAEQGELKRVDGRMIALSLAVLTSSVALSIFADRLSIEAAVLCRLYAMLACSLGLVMQFALSRRNRLEANNELLEQLLHMERQQHDMARQNIDIINVKCHDLKYQIAALQEMESRDQRQETIAELERSVMIYDSMVQSGNDAVDLVLTEKSLLCQKYNIKFSYIIDGEKLGFLATTDIYALFSNALDNAIECVSAAEEEKRIISLRVTAEGEMLFIHVDNYCETAPVFADGVPLTTKGDNGFHGFGTRSIQYIVRRYHGDVRMGYAEHQFYLDILFHLDQT